MELWKSDILSVTALQTSKSVLLVPTSARGVATSSRLFEPHRDVRRQIEMRLVTPGLAFETYEAGVQFSTRLSANQAT
jgi:hypothetical protein